MAACEKYVAPESNKTKRAREKLIKQLEKEQQQITPQALKATAEKIYKWIGDNAKQRVAIKKKSIRLFNQNKDAASLSKKVQMIAASLQNS